MKNQKELDEDDCLMPDWSLPTSRKTGDGSSGLSEESWSASVSDEMRSNHPTESDQSHSK
jgi:hypothetical protein